MTNFQVDYSLVVEELDSKKVSKTCCDFSVYSKILVCYIISGIVCTSSIITYTWRQDQTNFYPENLVIFFGTSSCWIGACLLFCCLTKFMLFIAKVPWLQHNFIKCRVQLQSLRVGLKPWFFVFPHNLSGIFDFSKKSIINWLDGRIMTNHYL